MASKWYYQIMGDVFGPVSSQQLRDLAKDGTVIEDCLVRKGDSGDWFLADRLKELRFGVIAPDSFPQADKVQSDVRPVYIENPGEDLKGSSELGHMPSGENEQKQMGTLGGILWYMLPDGVEPKDLLWWTIPVIMIIATYWMAQSNTGSDYYGYYLKPIPGDTGYKGNATSEQHISNPGVSRDEWNFLQSRFRSEGFSERESKEAASAAAKFEMIQRHRKENGGR